MLSTAPVFAVLPPWLDTWLTPLWILGLGMLMATAVLLLIWGVSMLFRPSLAKEVPEAIAEGPLLPATWVAGIFAVLALVGTMTVSSRDSVLSSLARLPSVGQQPTLTSVVPAAEPGREPEPVEFVVSFRGDELKSLEVTSNEDLLITTPADHSAGETSMEWELEGEQDFTWTRAAEVEPALLGGDFAKLLVTNLGASDAEVKLKLTTAPVDPQVISVLLTAISAVLLYLAYFFVHFLFPKTAAIALATVKSEMAQPLFLILLILGICLLFVFLFIPYHTFGEDIKVLKDSGLTLIMVFCIVQAVWAASNSVSDEVEGKTALTLLSKPIGRRQFILGKFLGVSWTSLVLYICLGAFFLLVIAYKPIYDARETSETAPNWQQCHFEMVQTVPGLVLGFFETLVFAAIGIVISTRLPLLANIVICFAIYAFGHLTPQLVQTGEGQFETVKFIAQFIATVLPVLDHFNINAGIAAGVGVPMSYLGTAALYCLLYCTIAIIIALVLFEDRDLA